MWLDRRENGIDLDTNFNTDSQFKPHDLSKYLRFEMFTVRLPSSSSNRGNNSSRESGGASTTTMMMMRSMTVVLFLWLRFPCGCQSQPLRRRRLVHVLADESSLFWDRLLLQDATSSMPPAPVPRPPRPPAPVSPPSLPQFVTQLLQDETPSLLAALQTAQLEGVLMQEGPLTILAPNDSALDALDDDLLQQLLTASFQPQLRQILLLHVTTTGALQSSTLRNDESIRMESRDSVIVNVSNGVTFQGPTNSAQVITPDLAAQNGLVHVIDTVLLPPFLSRTVPRIVQTQYPTLSTLVVQEGIEQDLQRPLLTVLIPDETSLTTMMQDTPNLRSLLLYHVVDGVFSTPVLQNGQRLATVQGTDVLVTMESNSWQFNTIPVVAADIPASNGILHQLSTILTPPGMSMPPAMMVPPTPRPSPPTDPPVAPTPRPTRPSPPTRPDGGPNMSVPPTQTTPAPVIMATPAPITTSAPMTSMTTPAPIPQIPTPTFVINPPANPPLESTDPVPVAVPVDVTPVPVAAPMETPVPVVAPVDVTPVPVIIPVETPAPVAAPIETPVPVAAPIETLVPVDVPVDVNPLPVAAPMVTPPVAVPVQTPAPVATPVLPVRDETILEIVSVDMNLGRLEELVLLAQLETLLSSTGPWTLLAPTDQAWTRLVSLETLTNPDYRVHLRTTLAAHVAQGLFVSTNLTQELTMLDQSRVTVDGLTVTSAANDMATIEAVDAVGTNGVVHTIDTVLLPIGWTLSLVDMVDDSYPTLASLLTRANLDDALEEGEFTLLIPTEAAFADVPTEIMNQLNTNDDFLRQILEYHVIPGVRSSLALETGSLPTLQGSDVMVLVDNLGFIEFDDVPVVFTDILAANGIAHEIESVLVPRTFQTAPTEPPVDVTEFPTLSPPTESLRDIVRQESNLGALHSALIRANMDLEDDVTLLAPTNDAFTAAASALPGALFTRLLSPGGVNHLRTLINLHLSSGTTLLQDGTILVPLLGSNLTVSMDDTATIIQGPINFASVASRSLRGTNGIIYPIDTILVPRSLTMDVIDLAVSAGDFTTLTTLVVRAGLEDTLRDAFKGFTILAPTDAAFGRLPSAASVRLNNDDMYLREVLSYHVLPELFPSELLTDNQMVTTLQGDDVTFAIEGSNVLVNDVVVTAADLVASNGLVHVLEDVLLFTQVMEPTSNLRQVVDDDTSLNGLRQAIAVANAGSILERAGPLTLFAPTNAAFALLDQRFFALLLMPPYVVHLRELLRMHISSRNVYTAATLQDGLVIETLREADNLTVSIESESVMVASAVNSGAVIEADLLGTNGVVHKINQVLLPLALSQNLLEVAGSRSNLNAMASLVVTAGLEETLTNASLASTILAPTDLAFAGLDPSIVGRFNEDLSLLRDVLLYHVIPEVLPYELFQSGNLTSANGILSVLVEGFFVRINGVIIAEADFIARNGIVHIIGEVLLPPELMTCSVPDKECLFRVSEDLLSWEDHRMAAIEQDCYLASVLSFQEDEQVLEFLDLSNVAADAPTVWLGGRIKQGGTQGATGPQNWEWIDGNKWCYENFLPDEPNNEFGNETVLSYFLLDGTRQWNDEDDSFSAPAVYKCCGPLTRSVLSDRDDLSTLTTAIAAAGLESLLIDPTPRTLLAPNDQAFASLPLATKLLEPEWIVHLRTLLSLHVSANVVTAEDLTNGQTIQTLSGEELKVSINNSTGVTFATNNSNNATVTQADIVTGSNDVVHIVDSVLVPTSLTQDLVQTAWGSYPLFASLVVQAGLATTLQDPNATFTILLPNAIALQSLDDSTTDLEATLLRHVLPGLHPSNLLVNTSLMTTADGSTVAVTVDNGIIRFNGIAVETADRVASNGLIHVVAGVLP